MEHVVVFATKSPMTTTAKKITIYYLLSINNGNVWSLRHVVPGTLVICSAIKRGSHTLISFKILFFESEPHVAVTLARLVGGPWSGASL